MKKLLFPLLFILSYNASSQDLYDLEKCKSYAGFDNWLIRWENSAINELKSASKLINEENRQNKCVSILDKYAGYKIHYYGSNDPRKAPVRTHIKYILTLKDADEGYIDDFIKKYENSYERVGEYYQKALRGETPKVEVTIAPNKINKPSNAVSKSKSDRDDKEWVAKFRNYLFESVNKNYTKEQIKQLQICLGLAPDQQTGVFGPITKKAIENLNIDLSNGFTNYVIEMVWENGKCNDSLRFKAKQ